MTRQRNQKKLPPEKSKALEDLLDQLDWGQSTVEDLAALDVVVDLAQTIFLAHFDLKELGDEAQQAMGDLQEAMRLANYDPGMCDLRQANADRETVTTAIRRVALDEPQP